MGERTSIDLSHEAESNLEALLRGMNPVLSDDEFVFATVPLETFTMLRVEAIGTFREPEAMTLILRREEAERLRLDFAFPCKMISLTVTSDLEAVGFLARVTAELAARGISVNAVSAYFHDHLFVSRDRAQEALEVLMDLQGRYFPEA
jgi:hypothetical protein